MNELYKYLDYQINKSLNIDIGFNNVISTRSYSFDQDVTEGFFRRYELIKEFQKITLELFGASLKGEIDPFIAELIMSELPACMRNDYHLSVIGTQHRTPVFFRTDEVVPGKISEIQCPGSVWDLHDRIFSLYEAHPKIFGIPKIFNHNIPQQFYSALKEYLDADPVIHHLHDNASVPHGVRYFIQRTRKYGVKYFSYDKDITPYNCNFVRGHDLVSLFNDNFARTRKELWKSNQLKYDLPPSITFDVKIPISFPFWGETKSYYSDDIRNLFPFTHLITPDGISLENGETLTIDQFMSLPRSSRDYYIKYAGSDISINWGSKGVYYGKSLSKSKFEEIFRKILNGYSNNRFWILQKSYLMDDSVECVHRNGEIESGKTHSKFSGFYGPNGLMGILVMQRPFFKVHGATNTVVSICT